MLFVLQLAIFSAVPATYSVVFETDVGGLPSSDVVINITTALAPNGAAHFLDLVEDGFFDGAAFFRVVPDFVVQFGIAGTPAENAKWKAAIPDDPVIASNTEGAITYAATSEPNSRTTQVFINTANNTQLDAQGFAPFGRVVAGMDVMKAVYNPTPGDSGGVSQAEYMTRGDDWIRTAYPGINFITKASVVHRSE